MHRSGHFNCSLRASFLLKHKKHKKKKFSQHSDAKNCFFVLKEYMGGREKSTLYSSLSILDFRGGMYMTIPHLLSILDFRGGTQCAYTA